MATHHLAQWAHTLQYSDLPQDVIHAATRSFYNWAGCTIGGSQHESTTIAHTSLSPFFGMPTSSLLGHSGIASHIHDYDDTHLDTVIHPAGPVASALVAVAEWKGGISGQEFIVALVAGIEAECKVGLAVWPEHYEKGWHITSTTGSIGAAVAISKLLKLSTTQTTHAIGIAATQCTSLREMFGSHTKSFHPGRAAQNGLLAAVLASNGYTSSETALEAKRGWARVVGCKDEEACSRSLARWLGTDTESEVGLVQKGKGRWEILRNTFKPFPCGIVCHPVIDGCIQLHEEMRAKGLDVADIESVHATVHALVLELTAKRTPQTGLEAKFSVFHGRAVGLVYGKCTSAQYEDVVVLEPAVISVRDKIDAKEGANLRAEEADIVVRFRDGAELKMHVENAVGSLKAPMTDQQLTAKFEEQCRPVLGKGTRAASEACWRIAEARDVVDVVRII